MAFAEPHAAFRWTHFPPRVAYQVVTGSAGSSYGTAASVRDADGKHFMQRLRLIAALLSTRIMFLAQLSRV